MGITRNVGIGAVIAIVAFVAAYVAIAGFIPKSSLLSDVQEQNEPKEVKQLTPEEVKAKAIQVSYDDLMRNNENYTGKIVHYKGQVVQVLHVSGDTYALRVGLDMPFPKDIVWMNYAGKRVLEGDIIEFWGTVKGLKEYKSLLGEPITIPEIESSILDVVKKQG